MKGRPSAYKPDFCDHVIKLGRQGKSLHQMAAALGVCFGTLNGGQKGIWSRDFNAQAYRLKMLNRFPESWRDKPEVSVNVENSITVDTNRPVEQWGKAELRAELIRRNALPKIPVLNGAKRS